MSTPSLDFLRGFEAAARHLSFTRAAEELFLTQSAISRQVKTLEEQLNVQLFRRQARQLSLTPEGLAWQQAVQKALQELDSAAKAIRRDKRKQVLTVTTTTSLAALWLLPRVPDYYQHHQGIDLRISTSNAFLDLDREGIDLAIRTSEGREAPPESVFLAVERIYPVCAPRLNAGQPPPQTPAALREYTLIHFDEPGRPHSGLDWNSWFADHGLGEVHSRGSLHLSQYEQLMQAATRGQGIALGRHFLVAPSIERGELVAPFGVDTGRERVYYLTVSAKGRNEPVVQAFIEWIRTQVQSGTRGSTAQENRETTVQSA